MIETVLFDIDNTLILFDENAFFQAYIERITPKFSDILPPEIFLQRLVAATRSLLENRGRRSNAEHYLDHFSRNYEDRNADFWNRFQTFYENEFDRLADMVTPVDGCALLLQGIRDRDIELVAASNPLWPRSVQQARLAWAGVDRLPYSLVTGIENCSFCKPQPEFYLEISRKIGKSPENCLMVGNDPLNDMIAGKAGMKTFLATDSHALGYTSLALSRNIRSSERPKMPEPDFQGPLSSVLTILDDRNRFTAS